MAMEGKLKNRDGKLYVLYSTTEYSTPERVNLWWRVVNVTGNRYNANRPGDGDTAVSSGYGGSWSTSGTNGPSGGVSTGDGRTEAEFVERVPVEPPAARGKELRWNNGRWEKLMANGWEPAGEGSAKKLREPRKKKSGAQLDREIAEVISSPTRSHVARKSARRRKS